MRVFKLELPKNLEWMVNSYTTPELKNEFKIMIKEDEELLALLENLLENPYKVIYTKLVGFFGERKVYTFRRESFIVKEVVDSFIDLVDEIKKT